MAQLGPQMNKEILYTQQELDIELLKQKDNELEKTLDRIESTQRWMFGLMGTGFLGMLSLLAHGFHWIN
jgi:hypothetical protein